MPIALLYYIISLYLLYFFNTNKDYKIPHTYPEFLIKKLNEFKLLATDDRLFKAFKAIYYFMLNITFIGTLYILILNYFNIM